MPNFLQQTAADILNRYPDLRKISIVLPSRRAAVFLKKELSRQIDQPIFSPGITTIEDFMLQTLGWEQADQATLMFRLYESYQSVAPEPRETFADFSQWAHLLLADFNELDRYKVNAREVFEYLADIERIKKWDLTPGQELSEMVENYLTLWRLLPSVYKHFTDILKKEAKVYQGLAYREMADRIEELTEVIGKKHPKLLFIGFNALNAAEEQVLLNLYREGIADFYWDVDSYYFRDPAQEAGNFLRQSKLVRELQGKGDFKWEHNSLSDISKKIEIVNVSGRQQQALAANQAVVKYAAQNLEDVAVVLAEEELLMPFLNNLAEDVETLNVTMGLPLVNTPVAGFFQLLLDMFQEFEHSGRKNKDRKPAFHYEKWDDLLGHPLFKRWSGNGISVEGLRRNIRKNNRIFIAASDLDEWCDGKLSNEIITFFEEPIQKVHMLWVRMAGLAESLHDLQREKNDLMQSLFAFYQLFNKLNLLMQEYDYVEDIKTASRFYRDLVKSETLDLFGEPLSGLQVMGMLETRTLDFKNIILTSLNEDILPKGRSENSLIPFDIKREFGLPTYLDKDAVFAYHFYRLLQRCDNVTLIYNGQSQGMGSGEPSRFIKQLEYELPEKNRHVDISYYSPTFDLEMEDQQDQLIEKTPAVMERLFQMAENGFSASALIDYINDPVEFYKKRVLGLQEADEVEEVAGYDTQGNVVHHLLEVFYSREFEGELVAKSVLHANDDVFDQSEEEIRKQVVQWLEDKAKLSDLDAGKNLLIREILTSMIHNFLKKEKKEIEQLNAEGQVLSLLGLEKDFSSIITLSGGQKVKVKGIIDRIDRVGDDIRVIDYKTGAVVSSNLSIRNMEDLRQPKEKNKALQLLMYAYLFFENTPEVKEVSPAIISLRNVKAWTMPLKIGKESINRELIGGFENFLMDLLEEIFNESIPFSKKLLTLESDE